MKVKLVGKDYSVEEVDYDERMDRLSSEQVKSIMLDSLNSYNSGVIYENANESIDNVYVIKFPNDSTREEIIICIREMTPGGRQNLKDEQRIQPQSQQINYIYNKIQEGKIAVLLGAYERDGERVLVAWKAKHSDASSPTTGISKQVKLDPIVKAMKNGFSQYKNNKGEFICVFRPEFIYFYIYNSSWIHDEPVEKLVNHYREEETLPEELTNKYNRIIFGAPGTGKSNLIESERKYFGENFERVTFHPSYSYSQFVGTYKPRTDENNNIVYEFVPGPFLRTLTNAYKNVTKNYLLIIEEINRANVAAVFGDIFQLLDRKNGKSEYKISTSEDMKQYLIKQLGESSDYSSIEIPDNMYIWATMNSADQGVYPIDTAFKRRWNFQYIDINHNESENDQDIIFNNGKIINWNELRHSINGKLAIIRNINEDKMIGPFFLNKEDLKENFDTSFKSKLLMYLYEDVLKNRESGFFRENINTYSNLINSYDSVGLDIFNFKVNYKDEVNQKSIEENYV